MIIENETNTGTLENEAPVVEASEPIVEDIEETIRRSYREVKGEIDEEHEDIQGDEGSSPEKQAAKTIDRNPANGQFKSASQPKGKKAPKKTVVEGSNLDAPNAVKDEKLDPPAAWKLEQKEWFNKQPRPVQEETTRVWKSLESTAKNAIHSLNQEKNKYAGVNRTVEHYLPKWGLTGITPDAAIAELCAAQDYIVNNPIEGCYKLLAKTGVTPEQLMEYRDGAQYSPRAHQNGHSSNEEIKQLTKQVQSLQSYIQSGQQAQYQQVINAGVGELKSVINEVNESGSYVYPELHDPNYLNNRVKPLVESIRTNTPSVTIADATRQAVKALRVIDGTTPTNGAHPNGSRLPNYNDVQKARSAMGSIRGRGAVGSPKANMEATPGESVEETLRKTLAAYKHNY